MDSLLVDTESVAIQECLDAFNLTVSVMVSIGLTGLREESVSAVEESLAIFQKVCSHRDPLPIRLLGMGDH